MRIAPGCALALAVLGPLSFAAFACGGGGAEADGAKSPGALSSGPPVDGGPVSEADATQSTTTVSLPDGGDLQGAKLSEVHTVASSSASAAPPRGPHAHEAGRQPEDIRAIVMARRDEARACYDSAVKDHPGIEGDLVIQWTIDPKGNVTQTSLDTSRSQIVEPTVVACVSDIIKKVQFAPSPGGYETKAFYPFNFHPHHGGASHSP
jgi:hypothetical protein